MQAGLELVYGTEAGLELTETFPASTSQVPRLQKWATMSTVWLLSFTLTATSFPEQLCCLNTLKCYTFFLFTDMLGCLGLNDQHCSRESCDSLLENTCTYDAQLWISNGDTGSRIASVNNFTR